VSVSLESVLWQNGCMDPDAIWDGEWGWSRHGYIRWGGDRRSGRGRFGVEFGASLVTNGDFVA